MGEPGTHHHHHHHLSCRPPVAFARCCRPVAEYRCHFSPEGVLIPSDYRVFNQHFNRRSYTRSPASRRSFRQAGWLVRDRFVLISELQFQEPYGTHAVDWLAAKPMLCNREYGYLFDKGTGKPACWLFSPLSDGRLGNQHEFAETSRDLLATLGSFKDVNKSKIGDRIGLCFSLTTPVVDLTLDQIIALPEVTGNGFKFSDGCGVMGRAVAQEIQRAFQLDTLPGAVQVRLGGVKGMLTLRDDFPAFKVGIRPSMVKFRSGDTMLEVKRVAQVKREHNKLFNQAVIIMAHLGVTDEILLDLQEKAFAAYALEHDQGAFGDADAAPGAAGAPHLFGSAEVEYAKKVRLTGKKSTGESFSGLELEAIKASMTQSSAKANLPCSITLMLGVIDEHGILEEGEVLAGNGQIQGQVLIFRSPSMSPGDIQKVTAVPGRAGYPYDHLGETLVFSAKGPRPLADMLAGGDLDGDEYYVIEEASIVDAVTTVGPSAYSKQSDHVAPAIDVQRTFGFRLPTGPPPGFTRAEGHEQGGGDDSHVPNPQDQLQVLSTYMSMGDVVSKSAGAWFIAVDQDGVSSHQAATMATVHKIALDARTGVNRIAPEHMRCMEEILAHHRVPHWKSRQGAQGRGVAISSSIQGLLHANWSSWIAECERLQHRPPSGGYVAAPARGTHTRPRNQLAIQTAGGGGSAGGGAGAGALSAPARDNGRPGANRGNGSGGTTARQAVNDFAAQDVQNMLRMSSKLIEQLSKVHGAETVKALMSVASSQHPQMTAHIQAACTKTHNSKQHHQQRHQGRAAAGSQPLAPPAQHPEARRRVEALQGAAPPRSARQVHTGGTGGIQHRGIQHRGAAGAAAARASYASLPRNQQIQITASTFYSHLWPDEGLMHKCEDAEILRAEYIRWKLTATVPDEDKAEYAGTFFEVNATAACRFAGTPLFSHCPAAPCERVC